MHCLRQGLQWETELKFKKLFADIARFGKMCEAVIPVNAERLNAGGSEHEPSALSRFFMPFSHRNEQTQCFQNLIHKPNAQRQHMLD